ncbi:MAG TPA: AfsR/SARP family transcriptional regulator [Actinophytocola sp.]|nr:AfsR/SARP family transcriptional regulator [Actinophytocola sp.]
MMATNFRILGPPQAYLDDRPVALGSPNEQRALVPLLAQRGTFMSREALQRWVWDQPVARNTVESLMAGLRGRLDDLGLSGALVCEQGQCKLNVPADSVDVHRFQALVGAAGQADDERAAVLYREAFDLVYGDPLGVLTGERLGNYRVELVDRIDIARVRWMEVELRLGNHDQYLPELAALHRDKPFDEMVAELLMLAHYRSGRQDLALAVYRETAEFIMDELGNEVREPLARMHKRILDHDPALIPARAEAIEAITKPDAKPDDSSATEAPGAVHISGNHVTGERAMIAGSITNHWQTGG